MSKFSMVLVHPLSRNPNNPSLARCVEVNDEELMTLLQLRLAENDTRKLVLPACVVVSLYEKGLMEGNWFEGVASLTEFARTLLYFNAEEIASKLVTKLTSFL